MGKELDLNFDLEAAARRELKNKTGGVSPTAIQNAVNDYLDEHPVSGADVPSTDIDFSNWDERGIN